MTATKSIRNGITKSSSSRFRMVKVPQLRHFAATRRRHEHGARLATHTVATRNYTDEEWMYLGRS